MSAVPQSLSAIDFKDDDTNGMAIPVEVGLKHTWLP
jgi:hypothetical protein